MDLTYSDIKNIFSEEDFRRGNQYRQQNRVHRMLQYGSLVLCIVRGTRDYHVSFGELSGKRYRIDCDCPRFRDRGRCKHVAAAMLYYVSDYKAARKTDPAVQALLNRYIDQGNRELPEVQGHLVPKLLESYCRRREYPYFRFRVGQERLYAVSRPEEFLANVVAGKTVPLGKNVTMSHDIRSFDPVSQSLIRILLNEFPQFRSRDGGGLYRMPSYNKKSDILINGDGFDRIFDLYENQQVESEEGQITFLRRDPAVTLRLHSEDDQANIAVETGEPLHFFGNSTRLYALGDSTLYRCSPEFQEKLGPLVELENGLLRLSLSDLPTFCSCVLPEIRELVTLIDPENLLESYLPEDCTPCFYFDMEDDALVLKLKFRYGEKEHPATPEPGETLRRDTRHERRVISRVRRHFDPYGEDYILTGEERIYDFLTGELDGYRELGEVFVSDRLRRRQISPNRAMVGVSLADGMLTLNLDTGEFPVSELESLYQSLLKKKKYHRLADGRFLTLDGSGYETLAEMSHMLRLGQKELEKGSVQVPAFRALYLDDVLSHSEELNVTRDRQFRGMIRNFKSLSESDYALPPALEGVLRPYQKLGFQWLKTLESCGFGGILADEMGLGKTLQVIAWLDSLTGSQRECPSLVVCPASLILNWGEEFQKFAPQRKVSLIYGTAAERKNRIREAAGQDVWVTSYELLRQDLPLYQQQNFYACILDEGQHVKNQSTQVSKAVKAISCRQRFVLTGTPIENRLSELWNLFDFLMPGYLYSHNAFVEKLEKPIAKSKNADAMAQLQKLVQPFLLRRLKQDVLRELPPKIEHIRRIPMGSAERKTYLSAVHAAKTALGDSGKLKILAALTQLRQICCDASLCFENYTGETGKLDACLELCSAMVQNGHQILLFSQFTSMLDILRQKLEEMGISTFTLQGSTPKEQRAKLVKSFNAGGASVFLISLKAGGTGLNLTAADVVIHYDPWWNLAAQNQATDRAHRIGQRQCVQVYKLIMQDTIEERILELQGKKAELLEVVSGEGNPTDLTKEDLLALLD